MPGTKGIRKHRYSLLLIIILALTSTMCKSDKVVDYDATITALEVQIAAVRSAAESADAADAADAVDAADAADEADEVSSADQPSDQPSTAPGSAVSDTFDGDVGTFPLGIGMEIKNGVYLLGAFDQCANDVANFDDPVDCNAVCLTCGADLTNYLLSVHFTFEDGLSDRSYGVILRFVDVDGDSLLDFEDYLLALGFNTLENKYTLYVHIPNLMDPWDVVKSGPAGLLRAGRMNQLEVTTTNDGRMMDIFINQNRLVLLTADHPQPGETLVREWAESGAVGLLILGRRVQARYDNFSLEPLP